MNPDLYIISKCTVSFAVTLTWLFHKKTSSCKCSPEVVQVSMQKLAVSEENIKV